MPSSTVPGRGSAASNSDSALASAAPAGSGGGHGPWSLGLTIDVQDLERSCAFYAAALGFAVVETARAGMFLERRWLISPRVPGLRLSLRAAFGKRVTGSQPGALLSIDLPVTGWAEAVGAMTAALGEQARWIAKAPVPDDRAAQMLDPDGYVLELIRVD